MQYVPFSEVFCHALVVNFRAQYFMHSLALMRKASAQACLVSCHALMEIPWAQLSMHAQALMRETSAHACLILCHALVRVPGVQYSLHAQALMRETSAHACLMNALAVSEFLATFGVLCEASKLSLRELQQAASSLSSKSALAQLYSSLLRCVLLEKV